MGKSLVSAFLMAAMSLPVVAVAEQSAEETVQIMEVTRGPGLKPPFKRRFVEVPVADIASLETDVEMVEITTIERGLDGKPPF